VVAVVATGCFNIFTRLVCNCIAVVITITINDNAII
jgi:hypothetical protein